MSTTLVTIAPGHQLAAGPAASYARALAAGCPAGITSSYRSPERQATMRATYLVQLAEWRAGRRKTKPTYVAAVSDSEHVTGNALDVPPDPEAWFREHPEFGFVFTDPTERWHVAYRADRDQHLTDPVHTPAPPAAAAIPEGEPMFVYRYQGKPYVVTALSVQPTSDVFATVWSTATGRPVIDVDGNGDAAIRATATALIRDTAANLKGQGL